MFMRGETSGSFCGFEHRNLDLWHHTAHESPELRKCEVTGAGHSTCSATQQRGRGQLQH